MTIGNPNILYFLTAILIVVIIHLLNLQKFKKVYFSNIRLLNTVIQEKKKRSKLDNFILVLIRSLIVACLVFAFSHFLFNPDTKISDHKSVALYIDNSLSNSRKIGEPNILDLQKKYARELVNSLGDNFEYHIISNDFFSGKHAKYIDREEALKKIETIELSNFTKTSEFIINKINQTRKSYSTQESALQFYLSDFQKNQHNLEIFTKDTVETYLMNLQSVQNQNISIESVKTTSPIQIKNQPIGLNIKLKNHNEKDFKSLPLKVYSSENLKTIQQVDLEANEQKNIEINIVLKPEESQNLRIEIEDNSFSYDNVFFTALTNNQNISVAHLYGKKPNDSFKKLYSSAYFNYASFQENKVNYQNLTSYDYIILDELVQWNSGLASKLKEASKLGVNILIIPSENINLVNTFISNLGISQAGYTQSTNTVNRFSINSKHSIYKEMFKGKKTADLHDLNSTKIYNPKFSNPKEKIIIETQAKKPFLSSLPLNKSSLFLAYSSLDKVSNFSNHQLFAPLGINMAFYKSQSNNNNITLGQFDRISIPNTIKDKDLTIKFQEKLIHANLNRFKQQKYISIDDQFNDVGFIHVLNNGKPMFTYGLNQNRKESEMVFSTNDDLKKLSDKVSHIHVLDTKKKNWNTFIENQKQQQNDWIYFLWAALAFYFLEMVFVLFLNKNTTHETAH